MTITPPSTSLTPNVVTPKDLKRWHADGFLHLPDLLDDITKAQLAEWVDELGRLDEPTLLHHHELTDDGPALARTEHFATLHAELGALLTSDAILGSGADLAGEEIVLYKEKVNYKLPGGAGFAPHQDATAYRFVDTHLTCMIAIDDATVDNGCLEVVAGRHHELLVDDGDGCLPPSAEGALDWQPMPMRAGDVLWFHSRTPHRSAANHTDTARRALFLTYNAAAEGDLRKAYYDDKIARLADHTEQDRARVSTIGHYQRRPVTTTPWRQLTSPAAVASAIVDLYERRGRSNYDEAVTQLEHALQCGNQAMEHGATTPTIVAAFLHDIGHLLLGEDDGERDFLADDLHHEDVGARFLANWFGPEVTEPIRHHVPAKRYLCAVEPEYHATLSAASTRSLEVQGGPMSDDEVAEFETQPGWAEAVELRRWDDDAKVSGAGTPSLGTFATLIESVARVAVD